MTGWQVDVYRLNDPDRMLFGHVMSNRDGTWDAYAVCGDWAVDAKGLPTAEAAIHAVERVDCGGAGLLEISDFAGPSVKVCPCRIVDQLPVEAQRRIIAKVMAAIGCQS